MSSELLRVEDLRVEYLTATGRVRVVDDVSFTLRRGEVLGLAGESGSGKTTIALAILRLLKAPAAITGGRVLFEGRDLLDLGEVELRRLRGRRIALVTQSAMNALNPVLTIGEQLADAVIEHERVTRFRALERARAQLEVVGIDPDRVRSYPHELSGGMRQRVVIAMALALSPALVLMDEPTTALDVIVQRELLGQITKLRDERGFSILFISHDLSLLLELCTRIGVLYAGRLVESAAARTLTYRPKHPYTDALLRCFPGLQGPPGPPPRLVGIGGAPPDPRDPPPGCRFHPRCASSVDLCRAAAPALTTVAADHDVACHRMRS
ncbi:MAG: ABC transporter ATP-binding protein [Deltaproteobacteria bacterium]|nr:ABC transporter ATP-binding protein [Kofleriaceae bacterium]